MPDIVTHVFLTLRRHFFDDAGLPLRFEIRAKGNTQDDPFDEYLAEAVLSALPGIRCDRASGPLITPDMVLYDEARCAGRSAESLRDALDCIVALEVKKLETTARGGVARASGLDFNTTPPCGRVRIYDGSDRPFEVRGFYLFVSLEATGGQLAISSLVLADGDLLNSDFDLYMSVVGPRQKRIGIGSYGDGMDRTRPMLVFPNPLAIPQLRGGAFLVHPVAAIDTQVSDLRRVLEIERALQKGGSVTFSCYRHASEATSSQKLERLRDPFPIPAKRSGSTSPRGRFRVSFRL